MKMVTLAATMSLRRLKASQNTQASKHTFAGLMGGQSSNISTTLKNLSSKLIGLNQRLVQIKSKLIRILRLKMTSSQNLRVAYHKVIKVL